jgi:hypothetical protein
VVFYDRQDRLAGDGKLSFISRIKYAMDAITSFSYKPLRLSFALFFFASCMSVLLGLSMLLSKTAGGDCGARCGGFRVLRRRPAAALPWACWASILDASMTRCAAGPCRIISRVHRFPAMLAPQVGMIAVQGDGSEPQRNRGSYPAKPKFKLFNRKRAHRVAHLQIVDASRLRRQLLPSEAHPFSPGCTHA